MLICVFVVLFIILFCVKCSKCRRNPTKSKSSQLFLNYDNNLNPDTIKFVSNNEQYNLGIELDTFKTERSSNSGGEGKRFTNVDPIHVTNLVDSIPDKDVGKVISEMIEGSNSGDLIIASKQIHNS
ncbi:MAG: hypothetical protein MHMPM18_000909 [Marteilia pararefringens]